MVNVFCVNTGTSMATPVVAGAVALWFQANPKLTPDDVIKIIIPKDVYSITPSFLEEFLLNIIRKLGMKRFFEKVKFISESGYQYESSLFETAERILSGKSQYIFRLRLFKKQKWEQS